MIARSWLPDEDAVILRLIKHASPVPSWEELSLQMSRLGLTRSGNSIRNRVKRLQDKASRRPSKGRSKRPSASHEQPGAKGKSCQGRFPWIMLNDSTYVDTGPLEPSKATQRVIKASEVDPKPFKRPRFDSDPAPKMRDPSKSASPSVPSSRSVILRLIR